MIFQSLHYSLDGGFFFYVTNDKALSGIVASHSYTSGKAI